MSKSVDPERVAALRRWFPFTRSEQLMLAGILIIFIIGLCARWYALRHEPAENYSVPGEDASQS